MAGGGLLPEHVPWLVRAGVRAFHIGSSARPLGSWKAYVDADLVRTWRRLIDEALRHGPPAARAEPAEPPRPADRLHRRAHLARPRPAVVAPGQRPLVRRAARLRGRLGLPRRAFERDHYDVIAERFDAAVAAGAELVDSREIVRRLHAAGLRRRKVSRLADPCPPWKMERDERTMI